MSKHALTSKRHLLYLLPFAFAIAAIWLWLYMMVSAQAWSRAVLEPLVDGFRFPIDDAHIEWSQGAVEIRGARSRFRDGSRDIELVRAVLRPVNGGLIRNLILYRFPGDAVVVEFEGLSIPSDLFQRSPLTARIDPGEREMIKLDGAIRIELRDRKRDVGAHVLRLADHAAMVMLSDEELETVSKALMDSIRNGPR